MSQWLFINESFRDALERAGLAGFDDWMNVSRESEEPSDREESMTVVDVKGFRVYLKRRRPERAGFRFFLRRSRLRREAENAMFLRELGVPTAEVVAAGERRRRGCATEAFVAVREIRGARPLGDYVREFWTERRGRRRREQIALIEKLALIVRRMHDAGYVAHDLYWRNILVSDAPEGAHAFWIIDHPRGGRRLLGLRDGKIRDLACLNRDAGPCVSRADRVRFVRFYLGRRRLGSSGAQLCRRVEARKGPPLREGETPSGSIRREQET